MACRKVTLRHGRVVGEIRTGSTSISYCIDSQVYLDHLTLDHSYVYIEDALLRVTSSLVMNSELVSWRHNGTLVETPDVVIAGNQLFNSNIRIRGSYGGQVFNNLIRDGSLEIRAGGQGVWRLIAAGNTISNGSILGAPRFGEEFVDDIQVVKNYVGGYIHFVKLRGSTISQNKILGCGGSGSAVVVGSESWRNEIDDNEFLGGCAHGIEFGELTWDNKYSGNIFRVPVPEPILDDSDTGLPPNRGEGFDVAPE